MDKTKIKYSVRKIDEKSDHDAVSYLDDEEMIIVESENGEWWPADEFFFIHSVTEFFVEEELG
jgi:hypothetical protein